MKIADRKIDGDAPPFVIAEIGVNHDGDVARAMTLIDAAADAGADAVKFQYFQANRLLSRNSPLAAYQRRSGEDDPAAMLKRLELSIDELADVVHRAHERRIAAIVTVFSLELVELAAALPWDAWKIASPDIIHKPLIDALRRDGRPMFLSTGASTLEEVQQALQWLGEHEFILMQCVSCYPTPDDRAALAGRIDLQRFSERALGYSDHTTNALTGGFAVASGARVLEKHLTYDRAAFGPDHEASLDPSQFAEYVRHARDAFTMLGPAHKQVLDIEQDVRAVSRQSIVAADRLIEGKVIERCDLTIKRPGTGMPPDLLDELIGRTLLRTIDGDTPLTPDVLR